MLVPIYDHWELGQLKQSGKMSCLRTRATTRARTHDTVFTRLIIALTTTPRPPPPPGEMRQINIQKLKIQYFASRLYFSHYNLLTRKCQRQKIQVSPGQALGRRCNRSRNRYGQIVQMHGYILNFMTAC